MSERRPSSERIPELAKKSLDSLQGHETLKKSKFEYVGSGGEHVVYRILKKRESAKAEGRNMVVKVSRRGMVEALTRLAVERFREGAPTKAPEDVQARMRNAKDEDWEDPETKLEGALNEERMFLRAVRKHFPKDSRLAARAMIGDIPLSPEVGEELLADVGIGDLAPTKTTEVKAIVRYQEEISPEMMGEGSESFGTGYIEMTGVNLADYKVINGMILDEGSKFHPEMFRGALHGATVSLLEQSEKDEGLKTTMKDFVRRCIEFTNESGEMLDLIGGHNVQFYKDAEDKWKYVLIDVYASSPWRKARETISKLGGNDKLERRETNEMMNALSSIATPLTSRA